MNHIKKKVVICGALVIGLYLLFFPQIDNIENNYFVNDSEACLSIRVYKCRFIQPVVKGTITEENKITHRVCETLNIFYPREGDAILSTVNFDANENVYVADYAFFFEEFNSFYFESCPDRIYKLVAE